MGKKIIAMAIAFMAIALNGFSQETGNRYYDFDGETPLNFWGVRANVGIVEYGSADNTGCAFSVGGIYNMSLSKRVFFEPGLNLGFLDSKVDYLIRLKQFEMNIPLNIGLKYKTRTGIFTVSTGPALNVGIWGRLKDKFGGSSNAYADNDYLKAKRFDVKWNLNLSIHFHQWMISLTGGYGLLETTKDPYGGEHQIAASLGFGYNF
ncbi:MAG: hypothetical protein NC343_05925 [Muribaculum sp.]|nr:hypothetical protein [Muribaculaceae bacterium]MCM1081271.1 hypothetical protein [Muribaculum sp.]